ncbi:uncharacterized protein [Choristoneura fumiferana]|uniref:uncharacterized protein n=1 Tax=Choristoneura fumiferana TaxID=7141 RepID=UPI003D1564DF
MATLDILMNTTADVIHDSSAIINDMEGIRLRNRNTPEYECGYLNKVIEEYFRKQVNIYNTSKYMNTRLYTEELVLYLEEIEHHYWQIEHVAHMLHEVERKHKIGRFTLPLSA